MLFRPRTDQLFIEAKVFGFKWLFCIMLINNKNYQLNFFAHIYQTRSMEKSKVEINYAVHTMRSLEGHIL